MVGRSVGGKHGLNVVLDRRMGGTARYVDSQHEKTLTKTELKHVTTIIDQQVLTLSHR